MNLQDKVAIITGAGRGIGRGIAREFARQGVHLVLVSRTLSQVKEAAIEASNMGVEAIPLEIDVANPEDTHRMVVEAIDRFNRIDILVNNAAVIHPVGPFWTNDMKEWAKTIEINVTGLALCCSAVLPSMIEKRSGKIINLSGAGVSGPSETLSAYGTSKAAVIRFSETLANEVKDYNIFVNSLGPGQIDTSMLDAATDVSEDMVNPRFLAQVRKTKSGYGASLEKACALAAWLASPKSDGLTGRMISATTDDWQSIESKIPEIMSSDLHTLRFVSD